MNMLIICKLDGMTLFCNHIGEESIFVLQSTKL